MASTTARATDMEIAVDTETTSTIARSTREQA
jgi:hypothetical protein